MITTILNDTDRIIFEYICKRFPCRSTSGPFNLEIVAVLNKVLVRWAKWSLVGNNRIECVGLGTEGISRRISGIVIIIGNDCFRVVSGGDNRFIIIVFRNSSNSRSLVGILLSLLSLQAWRSSSFSWGILSGD